MYRSLLTGLIGGAIMAGLAAFLYVQNQRPDTESFGAAVRSYLLENPEVLMEAIAILEARQAEDARTADRDLIAAHNAAIFGDDHSYVGGNPDGDVTLVEFIDYRCGYCRKAHPEVAELVTGDGEIRKIIKEFPILGAESVEASRFAVSVLQIAGPAAYKAISDRLMTFRGTMSRDAFERIAISEGLDASAILDRMDSGAVTDVIRANHALAQALSITGTPTFVLGEEMVRGYLPLAQMQAAVARQRTN